MKNNNFINNTVSQSNYFGQNSKTINNNTYGSQLSANVRNINNQMDYKSPLSANINYENLNSFNSQKIFDNSSSMSKPYGNFSKTLSNQTYDSSVNNRDSKAVKIKKVTKMPVTSNQNIQNRQNYNNLRNKENKTNIYKNINNYNIPTNPKKPEIQSNTINKMNNNAKNKNEDSDDSSSDYGNAEDDDFESILRETINIRETQNNMNMNNDKKPRNNPFIKNKNIVNDPKKNINENINKNINKKLNNDNNFNKLKNIQNTIKEEKKNIANNLENMNQNVENIKDKANNIIIDNLEKINPIKNETENKAYKAINNYFDKIDIESDKKDKIIESIDNNVKNLNNIELFDKTKINQKINNINDNLEKMKDNLNIEQNYVNLEDYFANDNINRQNNGNTLKNVNDMNLGNIEDLMPESNILINNPLNDLNADYKNNNNSNDLFNNKINNDNNDIYNNMNNDDNNDLFNSNINNENNENNNNDLFNNNNMNNENNDLFNNNINNNNHDLFNNNLNSDKNNLYNNNYDNGLYKNDNNNYENNLYNNGDNNNFNSNNINNDNINNLNNIGNNNIYNNQSNTPGLYTKINLENPETKNQFINHNLAIDSMLREINFFERLKSISNTRYAYFIHKYQKDDHFMEKEQFENIFIDEKNVKVQSPLTLVFHYIFNPDTLIPESGKSFFETIFTKRGDQNYLMSYNNSELFEIPKYFDNFSYVNNLFNTFNKNDLNNFLEEINTWKETFSFEQQFRHPIPHTFRREKSITMKDVAKVYFISPYDLIIDYHSYGSELPLSDTFIAITQYRFHCDINYDIKKGKFIFKTRGQIFNTIKFVKETLLKNTIRNESNNTNKEELQVNTWSPLKNVIESENKKNQNIAEQIYEKYLLDNLDKYSKELPKNYDTFYGDNENDENWNSFSEDEKNQNNYQYQNQYGYEQDNYFDDFRRNLDDRNLILLKYVAYFIIFLLLSKIFWSIGNGTFSFRSLFNSFIVVLLGYILIKFR